MDAVIQENKQIETATLGGGCFWCLEACFEQLKGVESVVSGYAGGDGPDPDYESVCSGRTGHAEVVRVTFDPAVLSFRDLLDVFFAVHDPTTLNRQGADVGTQYRSVVFFESAEQEQTARAVMAELAGAWPDPIVTRVEPLPTFYPAEAYHQGYFRANPYQGYCRAVVAPKVVKTRAKFADRLKGD